MAKIGFENGELITSNSTPLAFNTPSGQQLQWKVDGAIKAAVDANGLLLYDSSNYVGFIAPTLSGDTVWTLPATDGTVGQALTTDGAGTLSWADAGGGGGDTLLLPATAADQSAGVVGIGNTKFHTYSDDDSNPNLFIGLSAGNFTTTANANIGIGLQALEDLDTAYGNVAVGRAALRDVTTGGYNIGIGPSAGLYLTTGKENVFVGSNTGQNATTAEQCVHVGYHAGLQLTTGRNNIAIGKWANYHCTTKRDNICIGSETMYNGGNANEETICIGVAAGKGTSVAKTTSVLIGHNAGFEYAGSGTVAIGAYSSRRTRANYSVFAGFGAGYSSSTSWGVDYNVFLGYYAGYAPGVDQKYCVFLGNRCGYYETASNTNPVFHAKNDSNTGIFTNLKYV